MVPDTAIASAIAALAEARGDKSFCPSEVARRLAPDWRPLMPEVRRIAAGMDSIMATQKGATVDPLTAKGPIRLQAHLPDWRRGGTFRTMTYKPEGYTDLAPYLIVEDPETVLSFAETVFETQRLRVHHREDGSIAHAECWIGDTILMVGGAPGGGGVHLHLYHPDAEAVFDRAVEAGGTVVQAMMDQNDGDLRGGVTGPGGVTWWIARQL